LLQQMQVLFLMRRMCALGVVLSPFVYLLPLLAQRRRPHFQLLLLLKWELGAMAG